MRKPLFLFLNSLPEKAFFPGKRKTIKKVTYQGKALCPKMGGAAITRERGRGQKVCHTFKEMASAPKKATFFSDRPQSVRIPYFLMSQQRLFFFSLSLSLSFFY